MAASAGLRIYRRHEFAPSVERPGSKVEPLHGDIVPIGRTPATVPGDGHQRVASATIGSSVSKHQRGALAKFYSDGGITAALGVKEELTLVARVIHGAPKVTPLAANADMGLVDMPVQPAPAAVGTSAPGDLAAELPDPAEDGGPVHHDTALGQQIGDILV